MLFQDATLPLFTPNTRHRCQKHLITKSECSNITSFALTTKIPNQPSTMNESQSKMYFQSKEYVDKNYRGNLSNPALVDLQGREKDTQEISL